MKTVYKSDIVTRSSIIWCRSNFSAWDEKWKSLNQAVSNEAICNWNVRPCLQTRRKIVVQSLCRKIQFFFATLYKIVLWFRSFTCQKGVACLLAKYLCKRATYVNKWTWLWPVQSYENKLSSQVFLDGRS